MTDSNNQAERPPLFGNFDGRKMLALAGHWRSLKDGIIPPPIANSLDLSCAAECPNNCYYCNVKHTQKGTGHMTDETFAHVIDLYKRHDVKSCCIAGGGESLANPRCEEYFKRIVNDTPTDIGIITNGRFYRLVPKECRFINVSINAVDRDTYAEMARVQSKIFDKVCANIKAWADDGHFVTYKVMITDVNKKPGLLEKSVETADKLGAKAVLFRFAMLPWNLVGKRHEYVNVSDVEVDLFRAHLEVLRNHYPDLMIEMPFERYDRTSRKYKPKHCTGGAVNFVTLYDGDIVICSDHRSNPAMRLCDVSEFDQYWGSEKHKQMLDAIDISRCPRCSFLLHDTIVDQFVYHDVSNQFFI